MFSLSTPDSEKTKMVCLDHPTIKKSLIERYDINLIGIKIITLIVDICVINNIDQL